MHIKIPFVDSHEKLIAMGQFSLEKHNVQAEALQSDVQQIGGSKKYRLECSFIANNGIEIFAVEKQLEF